MTYTVSIQGMAYIINCTYSLKEMACIITYTYIVSIQQWCSLLIITIIYNEKYLTTIIKYSKDNLNDLKIC